MFASAWIALLLVGLAIVWWFGLEGLLRLGRRARHGRTSELVDKVIEEQREKLPPSDAQLFLNKVEAEFEKSENNLHIGHLLDSQGDLGLPIARLTARHWWTTGATGSGKSAHVLYEELQLIGLYSPWSVVHLDAKGESAAWLTELALPALIAPHLDARPEVVEEFLDLLGIVDPFDAQNLPQLNVLIPWTGYRLNFKLVRLPISWASSSEALVGPGVRG